jgi:hypothetical protein
MSSDFDRDPIPTPDEGPDYHDRLAAWHARNTERAYPLSTRADLVADLEKWWSDKAQDEIHRTVPKAVEYGAGDLEDIGRDMREAGIVGGATPDDELGIYFYIVGKMSRWKQAIHRGESVSDDTLFDIGVYVRMVQRIRTNGGWPGDISIEGEKGDG